ncbi:replication protein A, partial [Escherichia coli]|nr:replication protein A [Escherichia coli]
QTAIAKLAKLSRQTVAKYRHICNEVSESSTNVISLDEVVMAPKAVKHGVHQIPAPRRGQQESSLLGGDLKSDDAKTRDVNSEDLSTRPVDWPLKE